jgi:hypothetical protein
MKDRLDHLRMFFKITIAAFDMQDAIISAVGQTPQPNKMKFLHVMALDELNKETPDLATVDALLEQMELLAEQNKANS